MDEQIKIMIGKLLKEEVNMDIILRTFRLTIKQIEAISPINYGRYLGAQNKTWQITEKMVKSGFTKEKILELTGVANWKLDNIIFKNKKIPKI